MSATFPDKLNRSPIRKIDPNRFIVQRIGTESPGSANIGKSQSTATIAYRCPASIVPALLYNLLGFTIVVDGSTTVSPLSSSSLTGSGGTGGNSAPAGGARVPALPSPAGPTGPPDPGLPPLPFVGPPRQPGSYLGPDLVGQGNLPVDNIGLSLDPGEELVSVGKPKQRGDGIWVSTFTFKRYALSNEGGGFSRIPSFRYQDIVVPEPTDQPSLVGRSGVRSGLAPQPTAARRQVRKLYRHPPSGHPSYPWLYAQAMHSIRGITPMGSYSPITSMESELKLDALYAWVEFSVDFSHLPHKVFEGYTTSVEDEMGRYCWVAREPAAAQINVSGRSFKWAPNTGGPPVNTDNDIPANWHRVEVGGLVKIYWFEVPREFIFSKEGVAPRFEESLGKCNDRPFYGYPRGTLLFESVAYGDAKPMPGIACKDNAYVQPYLYHDLCATFRFFDPERGGEGNPWPPPGLILPIPRDSTGAPTPDRGVRGHQLLPYRGKDLAQSGAYYLATHNGKHPDNADPGRMLYQEYDMRKLFDFYGNDPGDVVLPT